MVHRSSVSWPIIELFDEELGTPPPEPASEIAPQPVPADALFVAACDVFLTRDGTDAFTLTLKHRGQVSEIKLTAGLDESGLPSLLAVVA
jgi:hypothetical protein